MPSELPEPKPKQSEKVKVEEDQESPEEKNEKTYTPPNKLGLPVAKFLPKDLLQNAVQQAAGDWEKDNEPEELKVKRVSTRTLIAVGSLISFMLGWVLYEALSDNAPKEQGQGIIKESIPTGFVALEDELKLSASNFLAAEKWEDVLPYVRQSPGIEEKLEKFQNRSPKVSVGVQQFRPIDVIKVRDGEFLYMLGFQDENEQIKSLYFTSEDPHRIIWETFVAYCDEPFEALTSSEAQLSSEAIYRVRVKADGYYIDNYNEKDWQALNLTHPKSQKNISAYVQRDSEQGKKLRPILYGRKDAVPLILLIKPKLVNDPASAPEILDLLGIGWHEL